MVGLADCNNFYASCERVFDPSLNKRALVVLSNNDGCIIARSQEAKDLNIKMGEPIFKITPLIKKHHVAVFSSNYTLYGDMSSRVMTTLSGMVSDLEIYSIDEAFLDFSGYGHLDMRKHAEKITRVTKQNTGIPISLGIAPTKSLAKVANKLAKKNRGEGEDKFVILKTKKEITNALENFPIGDVWGIGRRYAKRLKSKGINTALEFSLLPESWIKKHFTVVGLRLWKELNGYRCLSLETMPSVKKNICTARSFGNMLTKLSDIEIALANYTARSAEKLRKQSSCASSVMVFLQTNYHRKELPQYGRNIIIQLDQASCNTAVLVKHAICGLRAIFKDGFHYKKVGIIMSDIVPKDSIQTSLFVNPSQNQRSDKLMNVMDKLNARLGRSKVKVASQGFSKKFTHKQERLSRCYSTRWDDLLVVN